MSTNAPDFAVSDDQRLEILLDDLRVEVARLADAVEESNEIATREREADR